MIKKNISKLFNNKNNYLQFNKKIKKIGKKIKK